MSVEKVLEVSLDFGAEQAIMLSILLFIHIFMYS